MATNFVVTSPASSGVGVFKAHYATVETAFRVANTLLGYESSRVCIVDGEGNTILREDNIRPRNRMI